MADSDSNPEHGAQMIHEPMRR